MAKIDEIKMLRLGQRDENLARSLTFDCSDWLEQYPEASIHILFRRPGESAIVPMSTTLEGTTLTWLIHDFEVGKTGVGNAEFRAVDMAGLRRKSRIIPCSIEETLLGDDETVLYTQDQVDETLAHISEAAQAALAAKASEEAAALSAQEAAESATSASAAASVAASARDAAQAAKIAAETAQHQAEAAQSGVHADAEAAAQAKVAAQAAQASAQGAASQASADRVAAESARASAEAAAEHAEAVVEGIDQAGADQVAVVNAAGQAQVTAVDQAGTTQVGNVNAAGTTQVNAVQAKGTQVINSIPADYSQMSTDVTSLKRALETDREIELASFNIIQNGIYKPETRRLRTKRRYPIYGGTRIDFNTGELYTYVKVYDAPDATTVIASYAYAKRPTLIITEDDAVYFVEIDIANGSAYSSSTNIAISDFLETYWIRIVNNVNCKSDEIDVLGNDLIRIGGYYPVFASDWMIGNISTSSSGWTYNNTSKRCVTKNGFAYQLKKNDIFSLGDYTNSKYLYGYKDIGGIYHAPNQWRTADLTIPDDGDYVFVVTPLDESSIDDITPYVSKMTITRPESQISELKQLEYGRPCYIAPAYSSPNKIQILETEIVIPAYSRLYYADKIYRPTSAVHITRVATESSQNSEEVIIFDALTKTFRAAVGSVYEPTVDEYVLCTVGNGFTTCSLSPTQYTFDNQSVYVKNTTDYINTNILHLNDRSIVTERLEQTKTSGYNVNNLVLLHFSDIHGSTANITRLLEFFASYSQYIDGIIHTGDSVSQYFSNANPFDTVGGNEVMNVIGNHDCWIQGDTWPKPYNATAAQVYAKFFVGSDSDNPYINSWGIESPGENLCYYYKDYSDYGIRLIVLDALHYDSAQETWFSNTLSDAKANNLSVVASAHYPAQSGLTSFDCTFASIDHIIDPVQTPSGDGQMERLPDSVFDIVDTYVNGGGEFICWIVGHAHYDQIGVVTGHSNQVMIVVNCGLTNSRYGDEQRENGTKTQDCFNVIGFDTTKKLIKICRIGSSLDWYMRSKNLLSVNYQTKQVVANA